MIRRASICQAGVVGLALISLPSVGMAQASKSAAVAKELIQVMEQKKLDSIAAKVPAPDGHFAAALYFPNVQLLVISGHYSVPQLMEPRLAAKQYRDTYMELSGTVAPATKILVQDMGEPGLSQRKQENMYDTWNRAGKIVMFDGDPEKQKMSDAEYAKSFAAADEEYAKILSALLAEAKK
ncbi:MAG TPA: hypothetical protein VJM31_02675 [Vicinamibacterales bacterium]|nr:hypothetical protein [Vicinamibacterales bacterium]